jgi:adenylosuccinate synthase
MVRSFLGFQVRLSLCIKNYKIKATPAADLDVLSKVDVQYVTLPGWKTSIVDARSFDVLPDNCRRYIEFIESFLGVSIEWVGVGPGRESMLKVNH